MRPAAVAVTIVVLAVPIAFGGACRAAGAAPPASGGDGGSSAARTVAETVHSVGRLDRRDPAGPRFSWPGTTVEAAFTGTGIDVRLRDTGTSFFSVAIDGNTPSVLSTSRVTDRYTLASNLPAGRHSVVLRKRTESSVGVVQFLGFFPQGGTLVEASWPALPRRIEFIGDSVTCGYGDLGTDPAQHFSPELEDETVAYGALTAQALGAEHTAIAYSGIGVHRDRWGRTSEQMPARFGRALADDPTSRQPFATPEPDIVVVNLGTNDFAQGDPGLGFEQSYAAFVRTLRGAYPNAWIVCTVSPSLTDSYPPGAMSRTKAAAAIRNVVDQRSSQGDRRVVAFTFDEQRLSDGFGSDYHPSARTHRRMADQLAPVLRSLARW
ncbi:MAG TPA: SGNH/GDSL hydrolase family protein [Polyangiaceae bacterium]|nr:SGNH/GDSL hydrolase family protein [Polyangiaceae bacterium]